MNNGERKYSEYLSSKIKKKKIWLGHHTNLSYTSLFAKI